jgi:3-hydroxyisobutyrate dehydrogenase-like beta-hydroxyacid dehydrogenase
VKPLLDKMGKNITLVGGNGDGQVCKVANQIIVALNIAAVARRCCSPRRPAPTRPRCARR